MIDTISVYQSVIWLATLIRRAALKLRYISKSS